MPTLLTLGVDSYVGFTSERPFDMGGIGVTTSWRQFDVMSPLVKITSNRPFDVVGVIGKTSLRPFDLGVTGLLVTSQRPFDVLETTDGATINPVVVVGPATRPVNAIQQVVVTATNGTFELGFGVYTTTPIAYNASPAVVQAALEALPNIAPGDVIVSDGLLVEFTGSYAGMPVAQLNVIETDLVGSAVINEVRPGASVGQSVTLPGLQVYDKRGVRLGAITTFSVQNPPSRGINYQGSAEFSVPRLLVNPASGRLYPNPDLSLIPDDVLVRGDRIVVFGNSIQADDPWAGVMTNVEWTDGSAIIQCADIMETFSTVLLPEEDTLRATQPIVVSEDTPIPTLLAVMMPFANTWLGVHGEVLWGLDASGPSTFFGYEELGGDFLGALDTIVERSFGEWAWRIELALTSMHPVLVWRDSFLADDGAPLLDGPNGNIVASPSLNVELQPINAIRVVGQVTTVESEIPKGATALPYPELVPVAEVWLPTEGYRRRFMDSGAGALLTVEVPFTFEQETQDALAAAEEAKRQAIFVKFIEAFHAQYGRPWHDGWSWAGGAGNDTEEPEDFERLLTADKWTHYRAIGSGGSDTPVAIVMMSEATANPAPKTTWTYTVHGGDTLWDIAKQYLGNPLRWPEIYALNKTVIVNTAKARGYTSNYSHWIFPGEKLQIPAR